MSLLSLGDNLHKKFIVKNNSLENQFGKKKTSLKNLKDLSFHSISAKKDQEKLTKSKDNFRVLL